MKCGEGTIALQSPMRVHSVSASKRYYSLAAAALLFAALRGVGQETPPAPEPVPQNQPQQAAPLGKPMVVLPAGTRIPLALQRAISTRTSKPGDMAYLLTTAPVTAGDMMVIPPDTFVQGQIARITIQGVDRDGELRIRSAHMVFANGYTVGIPYDIVVPLSRQWIFPEAPTSGKALGLTAAFAAPMAGALIGGLASRHNPPPLTPPVPGQPLTLPNIGNPAKGAAIGAAVGFGITISVMAALLRHHRDFFVEGGLPSEMILNEPLTLEEERIAATRLRQTLAAEQPQRRVQSRCSTRDIAETPDAPGTPDTIISLAPAITYAAYSCLHGC